MLLKHLRKLIRNIHYRPLSLTSVLGKKSGGVTPDKLRHFLGGKKLIKDSKHGVRYHHSIGLYDTYNNIITRMQRWHLMLLHGIPNSLSIKSHMKDYIVMVSKCAAGLDLWLTRNE